MAKAARSEVLQVAGREVTVTNPGKLLFPEASLTKLDLVSYYVAVADGALRGAGGRPNVMVRYPDGIAGEFFFQKRAPANRPEWLEVAPIRFPSGREAEEVVPRDAAALAWMANLGCIELHPHPVRASDLDHPDELRVDLDPVPGVGWPQIRQVALLTREVLQEFGMTGWPKTRRARRPPGANPSRCWRWPGPTARPKPSPQPRPGRKSIPRPRPTCSRPTCWWTACAAAPRSGTACASTSNMSPRACAPKKSDAPRR